VGLGAGWSVIPANAIELQVQEMSRYGLRNMRPPPQHHQTQQMRSHLVQIAQHVGQHQRRVFSATTTAT
jgi:hypothetical protein